MIDHTSRSAAVPLVAVIRIEGADHRIGDTVEIAGVSVRVEGRKHLKASSNSGVVSRVYPVVSEQGAGRTAYRAVVDGVLYPIRQYGTVHETIARNRTGREGRITPLADPSPAAPDYGEEPTVMLTDEAMEVLREYLALVPGLDQTELLSKLVLDHVVPELEKVKAVQAAITLLPIDLLTRLADADAVTRDQVLALLGV